MNKPRPMVCKACKSTSCATFIERRRNATFAGSAKSENDVYLMRALESARRAGKCQGK